MALTGKGSTDTGKLSTSVKTSLSSVPKKGLLSGLVDKIKGVGAKTYQLTHSETSKKMGELAKKPLSTIIDQKITKPIKTAGKVGTYLSDIGTKAEETKIPVISQAGSITKAAGNLIKSPEDTRQNIMQIQDNVKNGKITTIDGILEAGTSAGLTGVSVVFAPYTIAIQSGLGVTGADKSLNKIEEIGKNEMSTFLQKSFGVTPEKADSRVNSILNTVRVAAGIKGGNLMTKGGVSNISKGVGVTLAPEALLTGAALFAKEEGLDMPTNDVLKASAANLVTSFNLTPVPKIKSPKQLSLVDQVANTLQEKPTKPKLSEQVDVKIKETPEILVDNKPNEPVIKKRRELGEVQIEQLKEKLKPIADQTKEDLIKSQQKIDARKLSEVVNIKAKPNKEISNNLQELAGLQDIKQMEANIRDGIMTKEQALSRKKELISNLITDGLLIKGGIDEKGQSYQFTEKAKAEYNIGGKNSSLPFLKEGVHIPIETLAPKIKTQKKTKLSEQVIEKPVEKIIEDIIIDTPIEKIVPTPVEKVIPVEVKKTPMRVKLDLLKKQKADLEIKVKSNPKLNKVLNNVNREIKDLSIKIKKNPIVERNKKVDIFTEEAPTPDYGTPIEKVIPEKKQPKLTKKKAKIIKNEVQNLINEKRQAREQKNIAENKILSDEQKKIDSSKELEQNNRMDEILDTADTFTEKELIDNIYEDKILSDDSKLMLIDLVETKQTEQIKTLESTPDFLKGGEKPIIDYNPEQIFGGDTPGLNILAQRKKGAGRLTKLLNVGLDVAKKGKDFLAGNLGSFLDSIYGINEKGTKTTLGDKVVGLKGNIARVKDGLVKSMDFQGMKDLVEKNKVALDKGFEFIKNANLNKLIPGDDVISQIRREKIIDARNNNELYSKKAGEKPDFANRLSMVSNYVTGEIQYRIDQLTAEQRKIIDDRVDLDSKAKKELKDQIEISQEEIIKIQNEVISILPKETQSFMNNYLNQYWKYNKGSKLMQAFDKLGDELVRLGVLKNKKENYYHGYITRKTLDLYQKLTGNKISEVDMDRILNGDGKGKERRQLRPEEVAGILKSSKDVDYLYDNDPMNVAYSYLNGVSDLIHRKMITDLINHVGKNKDVSKFLEGLGEQDSSMYNHLMEISEPPQNAIMKGINKFLTASSYGMLAGNPNLLAQNTFGAISFGLGKAITNLISGEGSYGSDVFNPKNRNPTSEFLFNKGLIAHRDLDTNINFFSGDASAGEKVKRNIRKYGFEQIMQKSTALGVKTVQVITANAYMSKFVGNDIKPGETIVDAYKRKIDKLNPQELNEVEGGLAKQVRDIEDVTNLNKSKYRILQNKIFNMYTVWSRTKAASVVSRSTNIIDTIYLKIKNTLEKDGIKVKDGKMISDIGSVITNTAVPIALISGLVKILYPDDDERQEELKTRMVAESFTDNLQYLALNSVGTTGGNIGVNNIFKISEAVIKFNEALENKDLDTANKAIVDLFKGLFSGVTKLSDIIKGDNIKNTIKGEFKYQDQYETNTIGDIIGRSVGLSKPGAEYTQSYKELQKIKKDLNKENQSYYTLKTMIDTLGKVYPNFPNVDNVVFGTKIDRITRNIQSIKGEKLGFDNWIEQAYKGTGLEKELRPGEDRGTLQSLATKNLGEAIPASEKLNRNEMQKLQKVVIEIEAIKELVNYKGDFNKTLDALKESHPKLHNKFMKQLFNVVSPKGATEKATESYNAMVDAAIYGELGGELFSSNLSRVIGEITTMEAGLLPDDYQKLEALNKTMGILENKPLIKEQIFTALSELVNTTINKDNDQLIRNAIDDFPNIKKLYLEAARTRGATFKEEEEKVEKTEEVSNIPKEETKLSGKINTKGIDLGILPTYSEKKKGKLINLIDVKAKQQTQPKLEKVELQTLLDKVLK